MLSMEKKKTTSPTINNEPLPAVSQSTILVLGTIVFFLAKVWPPLLLVVTYVLSIYVPYAHRINDDAVSRRMLFTQLQKQANLPPPVASYVEFRDEYWINSRGMCLSTTTMVSKDIPTRAVLLYCHGYTDNSSFMKRVEYQRFVQEGIAVVTIEYEGHGRSDGTNGYVSSWDRLVKDVNEFFDETMRTKFPTKKAFLMGESMGGAVCFSVYNLNPQRYSGVVFSAPMCKVADNMMPSPLVVKAFRYVLDKFPVLSSIPLAPARGDLKQLSFHLPEKRDLVRRAPSTYGRKPRLVTAREVLNITSNISNSLQDFDAPFLVQHGLDDKVTDPKLSQALYDESKSKDKTILLYEGMWHNLTSGEADEDVDLVFKDAIDWVLERI